MTDPDKRMSSIKSSIKKQRKRTNAEIENIELLLNTPRWLKKIYLLIIYKYLLIKNIFINEKINTNIFFIYIIIFFE